MRLTLTIDMDGAAFEDYPTQEVQRILELAADRLGSRGVTFVTPGNTAELFTLFDVNGNSVGSVSVSA